MTIQNKTTIPTMKSGTGIFWQGSYNLKHNGHILSIIHTLDFLPEKNFDEFQFFV